MPAPRPRLRPHLERLEGREVPATFTVTVLTDDNSNAPGATTLRDAIDDANKSPNGAEPDVINFAPGLAGTIQIADGQGFGTLLINESVNIVGNALNGAPAISVAGLPEPDGFVNQGPLLVHTGAASSISFLTFRDHYTREISFCSIFNDFESSLDLANVVVTGNTIDGVGGGVRNLGEMTITDSQITNNKAQFFGEGGGDGGGIYNEGTLSVTRTIISGNSASRRGGGIYNAGTLTLTDSTVSENEARSGGAGVYSGGSLTLLRTQVLENNGNFGEGGIGNGGGVLSEGSSLSVTDSRFEGNSGGNGGGLYVSPFSSSTPTAITSTAFVGNDAFQSGGGLYYNGGDFGLRVTDSLFEGNSAATGGGARATLVTNFTRTRFLGNTAEFGGGGLDYVAAGFSSADVVDCLFQNNDAEGSGGGLSVSGDSGLTQFSVSGTTFDRNSASTGGGAYLTGNGTVAEVSNSTFDGNAADTGGGIRAVAPPSTFGNSFALTLRFVTIIRNSAQQAGGYFGPTEFATVRLGASIVAGNTGGDLEGRVESFGGNVVGSTTEFTSVGTDATGVADPLVDALAANDGDTPTAALLPGSPAFGRAIFDAAYPTDQRGVARPAAGPVDAGAFQNRPRNAADDAYAVNGGSLTVAAPGILANDGAGDGTPTAELVTGVDPAAGTLLLNADGSFTFTPTATFAGTATFTYRVFNGTRAGTSATVTLTVAPPPTGVADAYSTPFGTPRAVAAPGVLANDVVAAPGTLTVRLVTPPPPEQGALALNPDGSFTFTPAVGFSGTATFTYVASRDGRESAPATVSVTVTPRPVANNDDYATRFGQTLTVAPAGVLLNDTAGTTARLVSGVSPGQGALTLNPDGSFSFAPAVDFSGAATFTYVATADGVDSLPATVTIVVSPRPVAGNDAYATGFQQALTVAPPGVLLNDGSGTTARLVTGVTPQQGALTLNPDGSFTFIPAGDFTGDATFTYVATTDGVDSLPATVTITVAAPPPVVVPPPDGPPPVIPPPVLPVVRYFAVGAGAGGAPRVRLFDFGGNVVREFFAFEEAFLGGVRVATADITGDGVDDVIAAAGPGGGPRVRLFDGVTGAVLRDYFAFEPSFFGGLYVAAADVTGDGRADIVAGAGSLGGPRVQVYDGVSGRLLEDFFAYAADFRGGVRIAAGDLDGDGVAEIVTGAGTSGGPNVKAFDGRTLEQLLSYFAIDPDYRGGIFVAVAPAANGVPGSIAVGYDGFPNPQGSVLAALYPELTGPNSAAELLAGKAEVGVFPYDPATRGVGAGVTNTVYPPPFNAGVRLAAKDSTGRGDARIIASPGEGGGGRVKLLRVSDGVLAEVLEFAAFEEDFQGSVFVG